MPPQERLQDVVSEALTTIGRLLTDVEKRQDRLEGQINALSAMIASGHETTHGLLNAISGQIEKDRESIGSFRAISDKRITDLESYIMRRHD